MAASARPLPAILAVPMVTTKRAVLARKTPRMNSALRSESCSVAIARKSSAGSATLPTKSPSPALASREK